MLMDPVLQTWPHYVLTAVFGGLLEVDGVADNSMDVYDFKTQKWSTGVAMPLALSDMATAVANGKV